MNPPSNHRLNQRTHQKTKRNRLFSFQFQVGLVTLFVRQRYHSQEVAGKHNTQDVHILRLQWSSSITRAVIGCDGKQGSEELEGWLKNLRENFEELALISFKMRSVEGHISQSSRVLRRCHHEQSSCSCEFGCRPFIKHTPFAVCFPFAMWKKPACQILH